MSRQRTLTWSGGGSPFLTGTNPLGMWLFVLSDALTFACLLIVYVYLRLSNPGWPTPFRMWPSIAQATLMTVVLLSSSYTMALAVEAIQAGKRRQSIRLLGATILLGLLFVAIHLNEWNHLIRDMKITLRTNPWNQPLFGATFFGLTGLHMAHVTAGTIYLGIVAGALACGRLGAADVKTSGLYWHFVDLVWMFLFPMIYLMSVSW